MHIPRGRICFSISDRASVTAQGTPFLAHQANSGARFLSHGSLWHPSEQISDSEQHNVIFVGKCGAFETVLDFHFRVFFVPFPAVQHVIANVVLGLLFRLLNT